MTVTIMVGDCREKLRDLPDDSVHCVVTSPPYLGLRDYGNAEWEGGDPDCDHQHETRHQAQGATSIRPGRLNAEAQRNENYRATCGKCGARRVDLGIGLEATLEDHIANLVEVFREVRRVLRPDGTLWLNYGDSYARGETRGTVGSGDLQARNKGSLTRRPMPVPDGLKQKDLMGLAWRVAFALQNDGWWLRRDVIWHKCLSGGVWLYAKTQRGVGLRMLKDLVALDPATVKLWNGERWTQVVAWNRSPGGRRRPLEIVLRSGERIGCTEEHRWPTQRGLIEARELQIGDILQTCRLPEPSSTYPSWLSEDALWFAGLYLAEGSLSGETIQLVGHVKEIRRWKRVQRLCEFFGAAPRLYEDGNRQVIHIDRAAALHAILKTTLSGRTAKDKRLNQQIWSWSNAALRRIVEGYLEGDGSFDGTRIRLGFTRNYWLERDLRCAASRLGATISLRPYIAKIEGKKYPSFRGEWRWSQSGYRSEKDRAEVVAVQRSRARQFWDISVSDDPHLFALASGVLTHNSNPTPESARDRPTTSHEYVFLLTREPRYFYDGDAVKEPVSGNAHPRDSAESRRARARAGTKSVSTGERRGVTLPKAGSWANSPHYQNQDPRYAKRAAKRTPKDVDGRSARMGRAPGWRQGVPGVTPKTTPAGSGIKQNESYQAAMVDMTPTRNRRSVWTIASHPYKGAHFACVDDETEILTASGWKRRTELRIGDQVAGYHPDARVCIWDQVEDIAEYPVQDEEMVRLLGRGIDQLLTPNHRCLIQTRAGVRRVVEASDLKPSHKTIVASDWSVASGAVHYPVRLAALIGWTVTDGSLGKDVVHLYQSGDANPQYCDEIRQLLVDEGADFTEVSREREYRGLQVIAVSWRITGALAHILLAQCADKRLPARFLTWDQPALEALWDAMMKGDGHFREGDRQHFVQKDTVLMDQVQALAFRLGYATTLRKRSTETWSLYKTVSKTRMLRSADTELISRERYTGTVWCPRTKTGYWVARRQGRTFVTGNTFPPALVDICLKAGTSEYGVCPDCGTPWERIVEKVVSFESGSGRAGNVPEGKWAGGEEQVSGDYDIRMGPTIHSQTVGWRPRCACYDERYRAEHPEPRNPRKRWQRVMWPGRWKRVRRRPGGEDWPVQPALALDPFGGAGTVGLVAERLGHDSILIELNPDYAAMARHRIDSDVPAGPTERPAGPVCGPESLPLFAAAAK